MWMGKRRRKESQKGDGDDDGYLHPISRTTLPNLDADVHTAVTLTEAPWLLAPVKFPYTKPIRGMKHSSNKYIHGCAVAAPCLEPNGMRTRHHNTPHWTHPPNVNHPEPSEPNGRDWVMLLPSNWQHMIARDKDQGTSGFILLYQVLIFSLSSHREYLLIIFFFLWIFIAVKLQSAVYSCWLPIWHDNYISAIIPQSHFNGSICFISVFLISWICSSRKIADVLAISTIACNTHWMH